MTKVEAIQNQPIDFEQIERDLAKMLIQVVCDRSNSFSILSDKMRKEWSRQVKELVSFYDWKQNPKLAGFAILQVGVSTLGVAHALEGDAVLKSWEMRDKIVTAVKEFFMTGDTGKRTEIEAKRDSARMSHESSDREQQSLMQQLSDCMRKLDDAQRKNADSQLSMARNG